MSQIQFFATKDEQIALLRSFESQSAVQYIEAGAFDRQHQDVFASVDEIPDVGHIRSDKPSLNRMYLVGTKDTPFATYLVEQKRGGTRFFVNQSKNPDTILFHPSGEYAKGCIVAGVAGTCTQSVVSVSLHRLLASIMKSRWDNIKTAYVSLEAERVLDTGGVLTFGLLPEYNLNR